jgi:hypothetical protein
MQRPVESEGRPEACARRPTPRGRDPCGQRHGGMVNQLVHEEVVCFFGLPTAHEDDALARCVQQSKCATNSPRLGAPASGARGRRRAREVRTTRRRRWPRWAAAENALRRGRSCSLHQSHGSLALLSTRCRSTTGDAPSSKSRPDATAAGQPSPLVGRELELERLRNIRRRRATQVRTRRTCRRSRRRQESRHAVTTSLAGRAGS